MTLVASHVRAPASGQSWHLSGLAAAQTKCGGRIMNCACTIRLNAMAAVTTASTRWFFRVIGLVVIAGLLVSSAVVRWPYAQALYREDCLDCYVED